MHELSKARHALLRICRPMEALKSSETQSKKHPGYQGLLELLRKRHLFAGLSLLGSTAAALFVVEMTLRILMPPHYYLWPPYLKQVFKPLQDVMPGISGDSRFEINSQGIRGDELTSAHTYRILALGGSTTECLYLDQSETWPQLLQDALNQRASGHKVWVGNGGVSGRTTRHHLIAIRYLPLTRLKIDAIVLLVGGNDFLTRLSQDEAYDAQVLARPEAEERLLHEALSGGSGLRHNLPLPERMAIWQLLKQARDQRIVRPDYAWQQAHVQDEAGKIYLTWREHRQHAAAIRDQLPDLSAGITEYESNVGKIIDAAERKSIRVILMTQPTMWRTDLPESLRRLLWLGGVGDFAAETGNPYYSVEALEKGMSLYNQALLKVCRERAVECVDLASALKKDTTVFYDDLHFNESGALQVSRVLAQHFLGRQPFGNIAVRQ